MASLISLDFCVERFGDLGRYARVDVITNVGVELGLDIAFDCSACAQRRVTVGAHRRRELAAPDSAGAEPVSCSQHSARFGLDLRPQSRFRLRTRADDFCGAGGTERQSDRDRHKSLAYGQHDGDLLSVPTL